MCQGSFLQCRLLKYLEVCSVLRSIGGSRRRKNVPFLPISKPNPIKPHWLEQGRFLPNEKCLEAAILKLVGYSYFFVDKMHQPSWADHQKLDIL